MPTSHLSTRSLMWLSSELLSKTDSRSEENCWLFQQWKKHKWARVRRFQMFLGRGESENVSSLIACFTAGSRLRKSLNFCVVKYAWAVKQKVWNEVETREWDWGETLRACEVEARARKTLTPRFTDFFTDFEKKTTVLQSKPALANWISRFLS